MKETSGFTLVELMIVISIIAVLSTIVVGSLSHAKQAANDSKRVQEINQMQIALEEYFNDHGQYPNSDFAGCGGWDTPGNGTFIAPLASGGYMPNIQDPTTNDSCGNYRYYRYPAGYAGCDPAKGAFYVIEVSAFESAHPYSPGFSCSGRDWGLEGAYVVGKFENG